MNQDDQMPSRKWRQLSQAGPESFDAFFWLLPLKRQKRGASLPVVAQPDSADAVIGSESLASASLSTTALAASLAASGWAMPGADQQETESFQSRKLQGLFCNQTRYQFGDAKPSTNADAFASCSYGA